MNIHDLFNQNNLDARYPRQPYIIAEAGVNHEGDIATAIQMVFAAKSGGADAIKFQAYKAETLACAESPAYWDLTKESTTSQYTLFKKYDRFGLSEYTKLKEVCVNEGIEFMCTAFDLHSAEMLNSFITIIKIASADITNRPLIEYLCDFRKPIILSTGASDISEIKQAVSWVRAKGNLLALLHCRLLYPTPDAKADLGCILSLREMFPNIPIGYSDHTVAQDNLKSLEIATLLGASIIEKHFTLNKSLPGNDHYHSMDKNDLIQFRNIIDKDLQLLGSFKIGFAAEESAARLHARRSVVALQTIHAGQKILAMHLICKRPGNGISPIDIPKVLGKTAALEIAADTTLQWTMLK